MSASLVHTVIKNCIGNEWVRGALTGSIGGAALESTSHLKSRSQRTLHYLKEAALRRACLWIFRSDVWTLQVKSQKIPESEPVSIADEKVEDWRVHDVQKTRSLIVGLDLLDIFIAILLVGFPFRFFIVIVSSLVGMTDFLELLVFWKPKSKTSFEFSVFISLNFMIDSGIFRYKLTACIFIFIAVIAHAVEARLSFDFFESIGESFRRDGPNFLGKVNNSPGHKWCSSKVKDSV